MKPTESVQRPDLAEVLSQSMYRRLFPPNLELLPQVNEAYELELAFYEAQILSEEELLRSGAYFASVGGELTRHFLMCSGQPVRLPQASSSRLRSFFQTKQFKTGYGTHGLFPYRGKFHPQMIKGLLNVMGLKRAETVLDPMMGSGTVLIEAMLMGINSIGVDASPFCQFMTQVKVDVLTMTLAPVRAALSESKAVFEYFKSLAGHPNVDRGASSAATGDLFSDRGTRLQGTPASLPDGCGDSCVYNFLLLAYLDSAGYSERSSRMNPYDQFRAILERYLFVAEKIQGVMTGVEAELGHAKVLEGDARRLPIPDASVEGIVFSPPYSFAIDYLENDAFHLRFLDVDVATLRTSMIGLRGGTLNEKFELYKSDMNQVLLECARVLRPKRLCTIVVGTNNNQLGKILGISPEEVQGIDEILSQLAGPLGLRLVRRIERQITGMANTMRSESILMLERAP